MEKSKTVIMIDMGHSRVDPLNGKHSPDMSFYEWKSNRELGWQIINRLRQLGWNARPVVKQNEDDVKVTLTARANRVNAVCKEVGTKNVVMVSIHSNAAASNGKWNKGRGWEVYVAGNASQGSKDLASSIYDEVAKIKGIKMRPYSSKQKYKVQNFTVIYKTNCKCCLTESLFYDNEEDLALLVDPIIRATIAEAHVNGIIKWIDAQK